MNYIAVLASFKNKGVSIRHNEGKDMIKHLVGIMIALCFAFVYKIIIDLHIMGQATHLNLFDWLFNSALQRALYV